MSTIAPSDIYPAVRRFLVDCGLNRALKAFDKETSDGEDVAAASTKGKKLAEALASMELTEACQNWMEAHGSEATTSWDAVQAAKKAVEAKQAGAKPEAQAPPAEPAQKKKARRKSQDEAVAAAEEEAEPQEAPKKEKKKRRKSQEKVEAEAEVEAEPEEAPKKEKKKRRKSQEKVEAEVEEAEPEEAPKKEKKKRRKSQEEAAAEEEEECEARPKKKKKVAPAEEEPKRESQSEASGGKASKKKEKGEKTPGVPFSRIDEDKWKAAIKDSRLLDNTHKAKDKFGGSEGDSWGDKAAEDLLKVKGKGFRKEMAKKKRASWKGGGMIDQGVNSIAFEDSDDE